ncbi:MAG TPA: hypothetical protein EYO59_10335, partial [Chromatiaceae bacterium]|nr:hypothetical protein [Chromatiaceae bacterium]
MTENISPGALPDTDEFHIFQLFDKTAIDYDAPGDVPPAGAPNEAALRAEYAKFGNMLYPATYADRELAGTTLAAQLFPLMGGALNTTLFMYLPIRRFSRGNIHAQSYSLLHKLITPNHILDIFQRQEATLAWGIRDLHWGHQVAVRTFPSIPIGGSLDSLVNSTPIGTFYAFFSPINGQLNVRDWDVRPDSYYFDGAVATSLQAIEGGAANDDSLYFCILQHTLRVQKTGAAFDAATIEGQVSSETRNEVLWFKKSDIGNVNHGGVTYWFVSDSAYKANLIPHELSTSGARTNLYGAVNAAVQAGNNLVQATFVHHPERLAGGEKHFNVMVMPHTDAVPDANPAHKRPSANYLTQVVDGFQSSHLVLPYSIGDDYYAWTPDQDEYYETAPGQFRLPHPMFPTDADKLRLQAGEVNTTIKDVLKRVNSGNVYLLSKVTDFYRRPSIPLVRSEPTTTFTANEALLGFYGMSQFLPSSIYPVQADFPPFLQTFIYNAKRKELKNHINTDDETVISCLLPTGDLRLTMESYETFDQKDKELATVDLI